MNSETKAPRPHIVVLGAGFAGLTFCQSFPSGLAQITVIDRQNHHLFQPLLYQVATAGLSAPDIAQPIRSILAKHEDVTVLMAEVQAIDLKQKRVRTDRGEVSYDYLILALGGVTSYFGHDEWAEFAPGLKTLNDALAIRRRVLLAFERAETETDGAKRAELLTTIVVGGGPTGVELAGAIAELARKVLRKDFTHIDPARAHVILVEGADRILLQFPKLAASGRKQLERLGVDVRTGWKVKTLRENEIEFADGKTLRAGNIVWGAGVGAVPLAKSLGVEVDRAGRIKVAPDCSIPGFPEAFALGDLAALVDANGKPVPGVSPAAMQMAKHAAKIIAQEIHQGQRFADRPAFKYWDKGAAWPRLDVLRRSRWLENSKFSGMLAWMAWLTVHLVFLIGFRNRVAVFAQWVYSYFTYKRGARIITGPVHYERPKAEPSHP